MDLDRDSIISKQIKDISKQLLSTGLAHSMEEANEIAKKWLENIDDPLAF